MYRSIGTHLTGIAQKDVVSQRNVSRLGLGCDTQQTDTNKNAKLILQCGCRCAVHSYAVGTIFSRAKLLA